jgi:hypothetical protein
VAKPVFRPGDDGSRSDRHGQRVIAMKNDATRNERLKAALRDNLKRRKA